MPDDAPIVTPLAAPVITRTPIQDDDGSGTTGTVLDNAWKQELYGQIDALAASLASAAAGPHTILSTTHTDTIAAALVAGDVLAASGSPVKLRRVPVGTAGQVLSVAAGVPVWADPPAGGGPWTPNPYAATDYGAVGGGTWTVDAGDMQYTYYVSGKVMIVSLRLLSTTIAGTVTSLTLKLPAGYTPRSNTDYTVVILNLAGPLYEIGQAVSNATNGYLQIYRLNGSAFPVGTNNTNIMGTIVVGLGGTLRDLLEDQLGGIVLPADA
jgi:hypothetical protein